jgi:hypothetical protein
LLKKLQEEAAKPMESMEVDSITKPIANEVGVTNFFDMIIERYEE